MENWRLAAAQGNCSMLISIRRNAHIDKNKIRRVIFGRRTSSARSHEAKHVARNIWHWQPICTHTLINSNEHSVLLGRCLCAGASPLGFGCDNRIGTLTYGRRVIAFRFTFFSTWKTCIEHVDVCWRRFRSAVHMPMTQPTPTSFVNFRLEMYVLCKCPVFLFVCEYIICDKRVHCLCVAPHIDSHKKVDLLMHFSAKYIHPFRLGIPCPRTFLRFAWCGRGDVCRIRYDFSQDTVTSSRAFATRSRSRKSRTKRYLERPQRCKWNNSSLCRSLLPSLLYTFK